MQTFSRRWIGVLGLAALLLASGAAGASHLDASVSQPAPPAPVAPPDTIRQTVPAGQSLVVALPDRLGDAPVDGYALLRGPALSGVVGHSFAWKTTASDTGAHSIDLLAAHPEAPADTLVVFVFVE